MSNFTKQAIKEAFGKLLEEQPIKKISVRAIVEECGINRNSFYYHFQDIPSLVEEIITDAADELILKYPSISSVEEAVEAAFNFSSENKKAILHICNSINRDMYERSLMKICEYVITTYFNTVFGEIGIKGENKEAIIIFLKCELFGLSIDWINSGMPDDGIIKLRRILSLFNGVVIDTVRRCQENKY